MMKAIVLASALLAGGAAFGLSGETALAAGPKGEDVTKKDRCEGDAMLHLYTGRKKSRFIQQCLASGEPSPGKGAARQRGIPPFAPTETPRITPLGAGNPLSTSTGSTAPSNAPVAAGKCIPRTNVRT